MLINYGVVLRNDSSEQDNVDEVAECVSQQPQSLSA